MPHINRNTLRPAALACAAACALLAGCQTDTARIDMEPMGVVVDAQGNTYPTVRIYNRMWFTKNLCATSLPDGTPLPLVSDDSAWVAALGPACCFYNNDSAAYGPTHGALYNWAAARADICPQGWRVATEDDWSALADSLGGASKAGGLLKDAGDDYWPSVNVGASDKYGFRAFPGGCRNLRGEFRHEGEHAFWWSALEYDAANAWYRSVFYFSAELNHDKFGKAAGMAVRCVKDVEPRPAPWTGGE